jgi:hypothetical protein
MKPNIAANAIKAGHDGSVEQVQLLELRDRYRRLKQEARLMRHQKPQQGNFHRNADNDAQQPHDG